MVVIQLDKARLNFGQIANRCALLREKVLVTRNNKPLCVIGPADQTAKKSAK